LFNPIAFTQRREKIKQDLNNKFDRCKIKKIIDYKLRILIINKLSLNPQAGQ
jgi:hypothetical protein